MSLFPDKSTARLLGTDIILQNLASIVTPKTAITPYSDQQLLTERRKGIGREGKDFRGMERREEWGWRKEKGHGRTQEKDTEDRGEQSKTGNESNGEARRDEEEVANLRTYFSTSSFARQASSRTYRIARGHCSRRWE